MQELLLWLVTMQCKLACIKVESSWELNLVQENILQNYRDYGYKLEMKKILIEKICDLKQG